MTASAIHDEPLSLLEAIDSGPDILSVYLPLAPGRSVDKGYRAALEDVLREARSNLEPEPASRFDAEAARVMDFLETDFEPQGRTWVVFSSAPRDLWFESGVQAELPSGARFGPKPFLRPLKQEPTSERACIVIVDRQNARVQTMRLGQTEIDRQARDYFPRKSHDDGRKHQRTGNTGNPQQGGDAPGNEQRSMEAWADEHYRKTFELLDEIEDEHPFAHLIVGGTRENTSRFLDAMPDHHRDRVRGELQIEIDRPAAEYLEIVQRFLHEAREQNELALVEEAVGSALAGGTGSAGWDDTMNDLIMGRVRDVLIDADRDTHGARCPDRHFVSREQIPCPVCGSEPVFLPSLLDEVESLAAETDAELWIVGETASERLAEHEGIAARLRY